MSEPENFLSRWSRKKREADAAPEPEHPVATSAPAATSSPTPVPPAEEPAFDLTKLPSLDEIVAETDVSMFMKPGVPAALRHAALRRAWASDPAIRDFRGLQENDWDFTAPDSIPGFGSFKSQEEIEALARRLFGAGGREEDADMQSAPQVSDGGTTALPSAEHDGTLDKDHEAPATASDNEAATAERQDDDIAAQRVTARRHGGALPE
ncbi:MAG: DUF3306 domain-containing protein [Pseudolabrys sp.]